MSGRGLAFRSVEVLRMPGFERRGFTVAELSAGVNLIYGPNGSGKTTLARAVRHLLAPGEKGMDRASLRGVIDLDGVAHVIELDAGLFRFSHADGAIATDFPTQKAEVLRRHSISLLDLAQADEDLAAQVARELAGGFDVARARDGLGFIAKIFTRNQSRVGEYESARAEYESARRIQEDLAGEDNDLGRLRDELKRAFAAVEREARLKTALRRAEAAEEAERARAALAGYPEGMERVSETSLAELENLRGDLESTRRTIDAEQARRADAARWAAAGGFPTGTTPAAVEDTEDALQATLKRIGDLRADRDRLEAELTDRETRRNEAAKQIGPDVDPRATAALDADAVSKLFTFANKAASIRTERQALENVRSWLAAAEGETSTTVEGDETDALREAVLHLERWLAAEEAAARAPGQQAEWTTVVGTIGLVALGLVLAMLVHPVWFLASVAGGGLLASRFLQPGGAVIDPRVGPRREFEALELAGPRAWTFPDVRDALGRLRKRHVAAALAHEKRHRWDRLDDRVRKQEEREREVDRKRTHWLRLLGLDPAASEDSEQALAILTTNLKAFQEAERERAARASELARVESQLDQALAGFNRALKGWALAPAADPTEAEARFGSFARRRRDFTEAHKILDDGRLDGLRRLAERAESEIAALYARAGLEPGQEAELRDRLARRAAFDADRAVASKAEYALEALDREVQTGGEPKLAGRPVAELRLLAEAAGIEAARAEGLHKRIAEIEARLDQAKRGHEVEKRLADLDRARDALRDLRDQDNDRNLGALLADDLARRRDDVDLPDILRRARSLFTSITGGRYLLDVRRADPPAFLARDATTDELLTLDQLSGGTRLQILLAARIAYLEAEERGARVPLVLDEAMGNSDERRAEAIIEAALALSRSGRQVFYLTAQHDEVAKWLTILERCGDVPHRLIDLAEVRRLSPSERVPKLPLTPPPRFDVPAPEPSVDGDLGTWLAYGRKLDVPPFNPHDHPGQFHLWYALAETSLLHAYLRDGIDRWGHLRNLVESGLTDRLDSVHPAYQAASAAVEALEYVGRLWKIGRGLPVDRQTLIDSLAVSDKFIDDVSNLLPKLGGDATSLIQALRDNAVKHFKKAKIHLLQDYLTNNGCLIEGERLDPEEIRERARLQMQRHVEAGTIDRDRLYHLLDAALHPLSNGS